MFEKFREFELCLTNECDNSIITLRPDNGGKHLSNDFETYLKSKEIHHELTAPYSPAQNVVAERLNCTLAESAQAIMAGAGAA